MTRLEWLRTLCNSGFVLQWGHNTYGWYPLRWLGRKMLKRSGKEVVMSDNLPIGVGVLTISSESAGSEWVVKGEA